MLLNGFKFGIDTNSSNIMLPSAEIKRYIVSMTMWLPRIAGSDKPRYLAIADAIAEDTAAGRLRAGTKLPTHRDLADQLGVTVGTVSRAYAEAARRGLVSGEVGRGTFALGHPEYHAARGDPGGGLGLVDLSGNHPPATADERQHPVLPATLATLARRPDLSPLLGYPPDGGAPEHRAAGAAWIARSGLEASPDQVVVSSGSQHGMTAVFATLLNPGDLVLAEELTYPGVKALAGLLHLRLEGVALDEDGLRPDAFESACRAQTVKALYCVPTIQNPTASVMPDPRRREVAEIARAHSVAIIEDDVYGLLPTEPTLPISAYAPEISFYVTGTAKSVAPGLRIGYILAPPPAVSRLAAAVRTTTWMAAPLLAEIASLWINDGTADRILARKREEVRARQQIAAAILGRFRRDTHPAAYHVWLHLPEPWRTETFVEQARGRGVAVTPAQAFVVGRASAPHAVRICLGAAADQPELERALGILRDILEGPPAAGPMVV
jgi:DNA-binding transcriptional MocR family regulator